MDVNTISSTSVYDTTTTNTTNTASTATAKSSVDGTETDAVTVSTSTPAAVYEPSGETASTQSYETDQDKVDAMNREMAENEIKMMQLVQKVLLNQSDKAVMSNLGFDEDGNVTLSQTDENGVFSTKSLDEFMTKEYMEGLEVDQDTIDAAKEAIGEDGYYGVEKTSDRLVEFAKALTGGDPSKIDLMRDAIEEGFAISEAQWGGELPQLTQDTLEATLSKLDQWAAEGLA